MNRDEGLKKIRDGIGACIEFFDCICDDLGDPLNYVGLYRELPLAREYIKKIAEDEAAVSQEKVIYISGLIRRCASEVKYRGFDLLAEETGHLADELIEICATAKVTDHVSP